MFWNIVGILGIGAVLAKGAHNKREDEKRKNTPCYFEDGISEAQFIEIAKKQQRKIKRLNEITVHGPVVYGVVESQSGISDWLFTVDFNDYGHITGNYWIYSDNDESSIPERVAENISTEICFCIDNNMYND